MGYKDSTPAASVVHATRSGLVFSPYTADAAPRHSRPTVSTAPPPAASRRGRASTRTSPPARVSLLPDDAVLSRGTRFARQHGNQVLKKAVDDAVGKYCRLTDGDDKRRLIGCVISSVEDKGGRFLDFDATTRLFSLSSDERKVRTIRERIYNSKPGKKATALAALSADARLAVDRCVPKPPPLEVIIRSPRGRPITAPRKRATPDEARAHASEGRGDLAALDADDATPARSSWTGGATPGNERGNLNAATVATLGNLSEETFATPGDEPSSSGATAVTPENSTACHPFYPLAEALALAQSSKLAVPSDLLQAVAGMKAVDIARIGFLTNRVILREQGCSRSVVDGGGVQPQCLDVVLTTIQTHNLFGLGNQLHKKYIEPRVSEYKALGRTEQDTSRKLELLHSVINKVEESGGRYLLADPHYGSLSIATRERKVAYVRRRFNEWGGTKHATRPTSRARDVTDEHASGNKGTIS